MEINGAFRHYYENLYCSEGIYNLDIQSDFLGKLDIPQIPEGTRDSLDGEITTLEISEAVSAMNAGKTAGPDGLPIDIYKMFKDKLVAPLYEMFKESYANGILPPSLREALIIVLPKPGKPKTKCGNLRPISLLNSDTKILCKVIARRLEGILPSIVGKDQNGFIQGRQGFHNVRRVLNILYNQEGAPDTALLSIDAEKAFNRFQVLQLDETIT